MKHIFQGGEKYNHLTVINELEKTGRTRRILCKCKCGDIRSYRMADVLSNHSKSCGCHRKENSRKMLLKHGLTKTPEFNIWVKMRARCYSEKNNRYKNYGGRGITVCDRWLNSFENFYADMGPRPSKIYSIDRMDVNGNYCKENCRWILTSEQGFNKTNNRTIMYNGDIKTVYQLDKILGYKPGTIRNRLDAGWSENKAIETPIRNKTIKRGDVVEMIY